MKKFIEWVLEEEGVLTFTDTSVYFTAMEVVRYLSISSECMYMYSCGEDREEQLKRAKIFMQKARRDMVPLWNWYHDYYDKFKMFGSPQNLWSIASDCKYDKEGFGDLAICFRTMANWWDNVMEKEEDDNA